MKDTKTAAQSLGVTVHSVEIRTADDFARAFASIRKGGAEALVVGSGQFLFSHQRKVIESVERPTKFDVIINLKTANAPWANDPPIAACSRRRDHPMMED